jgi:hypothetical protein
MANNGWDGGWGIGYDTTAAYARKALDEAGITREACKTMPMRELERIVGHEGAVRLYLHGLCIEGQRDWEERFRRG